MRLGLFLTVGVLIQAYFTATITGGSWLNIVTIGGVTIGGVTIGGVTIGVGSVKLKTHP